MLDGKDLVQMYGLLVVMVSTKDLPDTEKLTEKIGDLLASSYDHSESLSN